jgi:hypothetical protein
LKHLASSCATLRLGRDNPIELRILNTNGSEEGILYEMVEAFSVSNTGNIAFITQDNMYTMRINKEEPIWRDKADGYPLWAPDGEKLLYSDFKVLTVKTGEKQILHPPNHTILSEPSWSPDSQKIAATGLNAVGFHWQQNIYVFDIQDSSVYSLLRR